MYRVLAVAVAGAIAIASAHAQPGPGPGGQGPGKGPGFSFGQSNTAGWSLMSAEERKAHRDAMLAAKTADECKAVRDRNHAAMEARAKEKGVTLPAAPRADMCERMMARGRFK